MSVKTSPRRLEVQLSVDHPSLSSRSLENILTSAADEAWDVGQTYQPGRNAQEQRYQFSRWAIRVAAMSLADLPEAIRELTSVFKGWSRDFFCCLATRL